MNKNHSCCEEKKQEQAGIEKKRRAPRSYVTGAVAAFLACLCCSLPLIPLMIGLGGVTIFKEQLGQYHLVFEVGAILILLTACGYMWKEHQRSGKALHSFALQVAVTFAMYGVMTFAMQAFLAPILLGSSESQMKIHKH
ncbi:MAG: hypothetical protein K2X27_18075 [Candidatus Obscuribacterales bacterium]|nr:hypothetical protein [Candidatus Obscuribacterales bacterium]